MEQQNMNWENYCPQCRHFDSNTGACSMLHFNISSSPKTFSKKCNGQFYELDKNKKKEVEVTLTESQSHLEDVQRKAYSKGGLIATVVMTVLCAMVLLTKFNTEYMVSYLVANVALLWRSFRPPLRWWQAVLVWIGGLAIGSSFSVFLGPPTFEEKVLGSEAVLPSKVGVFIIGFTLGSVVILLGSLCRKIDKS